MSSTLVNTGRAKPFARAGGPILPPYTQESHWLHTRLGKMLLFFCVCGFCLVWGFFYAIFTPVFILFFIAPLPILAMVAIWALPDIRRPPLQMMTNMLFVFMACLVLWPNYIAFAPPGIPWITMTRLSGFPLVLFLLLCVSTSVDYREKVGAAMRATPWISGMFIAFNVLEMVSIGFSRAPIFSFNAFVNAQIGLTTVFFVSLYAFHKPGRITSMIRLLWIMAIIVGVITVAEAKVRHPLWAGHIPSFLHIDDPSVDRAMVGMSRNGQYRAAGTFINALGLAEYMALVLPFVLNYLIGPYRTAIRVAAAVSAPFILFATFLSGSRLGLVGSFLSIALTIVVWAANRLRQDRQSLAAMSTIMAFPASFGTIIISSFFVGAIRVRVWGSGADGGAASTDERKAQFALGWPKVLHAPWGHGIGTAAETLGYAPWGILTIDTYYLAVLLEFGPLGFFLFFGMFVNAAVRCAIAAVRYKGNDPEMDLLKPLAISLINFFIIKSVFSEVNNHPIVIMMLGIISVLLYRVSTEKAAETAPAAAAVPARLRRRPGLAVPVRASV
jgi:hypothetical protein